MPSSAPFDAAAFEENGCWDAPALLDAVACDAFSAAVGDIDGAGARHLIDHPAVRALLQRQAVTALMKEVLGAGAFAYKATLFDKHAEANWLVAWHQDISIPVQQRLELQGWTGWSRKEHVLYVQAPTEVLAELVALRISLDDCRSDNGPLRLLVGSHRLGRLKHDGIAHQPDRYAERVITGPQGGGLLMRPLTIHASSKTAVDMRRRVLHLEFANFQLPFGLKWHRQVALAH